MKRIFKLFLVLLVVTTITIISCVSPDLQPINLGNEVDFSSPILQLGESWQGQMGGLLQVSVNYDVATNTITETIENISSQTLCYGLSEPHMRLGAQTVGELGPITLGNLSPGQIVNTNVSVFNDPGFTGFAFDGYNVHMEVYDCNGGAPPPY